MKSFRWQVGIICFLAAAGYLFYACVLRMGPEEFAVKEDRQTGEYSLLHSGWAFEWHGIYPGRVRVMRFPKRSAESTVIGLPMPALEELKSDRYAIKIPVSFAFFVDSRALSMAPERLASQKNAIAAFAGQALGGYLAKEASAYLEPVYDRNGLSRAQNDIVKKAGEKWIAFLGRAGINVTSFEISGGISLPDERLYYEGIAFLRELRELERSEKKELVALKGSLEREKLRRQEFMDKLSETSKLLKTNPDLLKYIYIDKLAGNVKVIIAPDKSGMPFGLNLAEPAGKPGQREEVDNLK
jgi:hypothetical protein